MTVTFLDTVRGTLARKIVPLHDTGKTTTPADTNHVDTLDVLKHIHRDVLANLDTADVATQLTDEFLGSQSALVGATARGNTLLRRACF